jgi:hypothetical protein
MNELRIESPGWEKVLERRHVRSLQAYSCSLSLSLGVDKYGQMSAFWIWI